MHPLLSYYAFSDSGNRKMAQNSEKIPEVIHNVRDFWAPMVERICDSPLNGLPCLKCKNCLSRGYSRKVFSKQPQRLIQHRVSDHVLTSDISSLCDDPDRIDQRDSDVPKWVPCRKCERCQNIRMTDLAGRCYAEALTSDHMVALTLTYADWTGSRAQHLQYRDFQLMMKRLRFDGYKVRFIVAGEYGAKRQRAHWHCILYFQGACPPLPPEETEKVHWKYWADVPHRNDVNAQAKPLGFVYVQRPTYSGVRYVIKYATKDEGTGKSSRKVTMSKKPPLGSAYWHVMAEQQVKAGMPFTFRYTLQDAVYSDGTPVQFYAKDKSGKLKWEAYKAAWLRHHPNKRVLIDEKAYASWWRQIVPAPLRTYLKETRRDLKLPRGRLSSTVYEKSLTFKDRALLRLPTGDIVGLKYHGPDKELQAWRVGDLREMIAIARGRRVQRARSVKYGVCPF